RSLYSGKPNLRRYVARRRCAIACFWKRGFVKKPGQVYIAAGEEEYRLLNPPLQEYVTPGWLGKAIACFAGFFQKTGAGLYSCWRRRI
ncbi:MAG: hypothetical protein P5681_26635, partial [Limnospira sp. PMC 894.15]|uniref:hypothetical protein n=1 Tax=unclassified Limnospira TaxID=2642885 RepID=UPI0028E16990